jgi:excisionase family DNA binding protein
MDQTFQPKNRLLSVKETAEILRLSPRTIYNRVAPGAENPFPIKPKRIGRSVRFRNQDVQDYIDHDLN